MARRASAEALIRIGALPDSSLRRALNGTVDAVRRSQVQVRAETDKTAKYQQQVAERGARLQIAINNAARRDKERAERAATKVTEREAKAQLSAVERAAKAQARAQEQAEKAKQREMQRTLREAEKASRQQIRESEKTARTQIRDAQRAAREMERVHREAAHSSRRFWTNVATGAGAIGGGAGAALGFAGGVAGDLGVVGPAQTIGSAKEITDSLIRSLGQAGFSADFVKNTVRQIDEAAKRNTVGQGGLAAGLLKAQAKYSDPEFFLKNIDFFAKMSRASGSSPEQLADFAMGQRQIGGLTDDQSRDVTAAAFLQGGKGSIEFKEMASQFGPAIATFAQDMNARGMEEMLQIQGIVQVLAKSLKDPAEVATVLERFGGQLKRKTVQTKLKAVGIDIADEKGNINKSPAEIMKMIADSPAMQSPQVRQRIFPEVRGEAGAATMVDRITADSSVLRDLINVDPEQGKALAESINAMLDATPFSKIDEMNIEAQSVTLSGAEKIIEQMVEIAKVKQAADELAFENPAAAGALTTLGGAGLGALILRRLGGGLLPKALPKLLTALPGAPVMTAASGGGAVSTLGRFFTSAAPAVSGAGAGPLALLSVHEQLSEEAGTTTPILDAIQARLDSVFGASEGSKGGVEISKDSVAALSESLKKHPEATVRIVVDGPGRVTRVDETDLHIDLGTGSGRMSAAR